MYIKPNGDVWACPFLPAQVGNVRTERADTILENLGNFFVTAKSGSECEDCEYEPVCGGCKTREEPKCMLER
jgi:radical SAM protein with 4Fe4S-binding SPASM domain